MEKEERYVRAVCNNELLPIMIDSSAGQLAPRQIKTSINGQNVNLLRSHAGTKARREVDQPVRHGLGKTGMGNRDMIL